MEYPEKSQGTTALVLGILGLLGCFVLAPFAWYLGSREAKAIEAGERDPAGRLMANVGRVLGIAGTVLGLVAVGVFVVRPVLEVFERQEAAVERMFDEIDRQIEEMERQSSPTTAADTPTRSTSATVPIGTISTEELVEWCIGDGTGVTVFEPLSEEWMRDCEESFETRQAFDAAVRLHQTNLSDDEIVWCELNAAEVFEAAKSIGLESIHPDMEFLPNRSWVETFWLYDSPEDYVQACITAFGARDD